MKRIWGASIPRRDPSRAPSPTVREVERCAGKANSGVTGIEVDADAEWAGGEAQMNSTVSRRVFTHCSRRVFPSGPEVTHEVLHRAHSAADCRLSCARTPGVLHRVAVSGRERGAVRSLSRPVRRVADGAGLRPRLAACAPIRGQRLLPVRLGRTVGVHERRLGLRQRLPLWLGGLSLRPVDAPLRSRLVVDPRLAVGPLVGELAFRRAVRGLGAAGAARCDRRGVSRLVLRAVRSFHRAQRARVFGRRVRVSPGGRGDRTFARARAPP